MTKIKTALCSFGMSGLVFHAPFLHAHSGFELYGVLERTKNLAVEKYPNIKTFKTLEQLLADENIELVIVNTPSITHFDFAKKVLLANKHVIVEKPFVATINEADELINLATIKNKILSVFHNRRWDSDFLTVKKIVASNVLGDLKEVEIHYDRFTPALSPKVHKEINTGAVGIIYDLGAHLIDAALQLFGFPNAIFADIMQMRIHTQVDDYCEILFYYNSFRVRIKATFFAKAPQGYILHGSLGSFIKSRSDVQEEQLKLNKNPNDLDYGIDVEKDYGELYLDKNGETQFSKIKSERGHYIEYYQGIYNAIINNQLPPVSALQAKNVIQIIQAAYHSNKEKRIIYLK